MNNTQGQGLARIITRLAGDELARRLLGPGLIALVIKAASAITSYGMLVVFARLLDETDYGHFGFIMNLSIVVAAFIGFGLPTAVMRFWPEHLAKGEKHLARGFMRDAMTFILAASTIAVTIGLGLSLAGIGHDAFGIDEGILAVTVLASLLALSDFLANALRAQSNTVWSMLPRDIGWRVLAPCVAIAASAATGHIGLIPALVATIATLAGVMAVQFWKFRRETLAAAGTSMSVSNWPYWRSALYGFGASGILYAMVQQLDVVVVGLLAGPAEAGAYFAAQKTASLLGLAMIAGGLVAAPMMSTAYHSNNIAELQRICRLLALAIAGTTLLGFGFLALIGSHLLAIFEPAYAKAYPILIILSLGYACDALAGPSAYLMQMTALERPYVRVMAIVYGFVLALQCFLIPRYGVISAAVASAAGVCLWNIIAVQLLREKIGVDPSIFGFLHHSRPSTP